jgi:protein-S-isoprenylcysteine O-methyltransferase Ste14
MVNASKSLLTNRMFYTKILVVFLVLPVALFADPLISDKGIAYSIMQLVGYLLIPLCVLGRSYCTLFIGGRKTYSLVTMGPYSLVRNPLYVFSFIGIIGIGLQIGMISLLAVMVLIFFLYYSEVITREESGLFNNFGKEYLEYTKKVPRWFPRTWKFSMPELVEASPKRVLKTMRDAWVFFLAFPVVELIRYLHTAGIIPVLIHLP